jgi:hypothetical protein
VRDAHSHFGLVCDVLEQAELILYDGSRVIASSAESADLFWAIRGGGTGFGVVTSMTFSHLSLAAGLECADYTSIATCWEGSAADAAVAG